MNHLTNLKVIHWIFVLNEKKFSIFQLILPLHLKWHLIDPHTEQIKVGVNHKIKNCHFRSCLGTIVGYDNIWDDISKNVKFKVKGHLFCILMSKHLGFLALLVTGFYAYILTSFWSVFGHKLTIKVWIWSWESPFFEILPPFHSFLPQNQIFHFFFNQKFQDI